MTDKFDMLYHATYKAHLASIKKNGICPQKKHNYDECMENVVYLAYDKDVARSYAETSDEVPEEWLDNIVILEVDSKGLDITKFQKDLNLLDGGEITSVAYKGSIPFELCKIVSDKEGF